MTVSDENVLGQLLEASEKLVTSLTELGGRALHELQDQLDVDRWAQELRQARAVGQLTVLAASAKLKSHFLSEPSPEPEASPSVPEAAPEPPRGIPGYENLSAAQIVPLLKGLTAQERDEVLEFESATRQRKTILSALRTKGE